MIALSVALLVATTPAPLTIAFAPPIGTPLRYETRETRVQEGKSLCFTLVQRYVFAREGDGYRLDSTTMSYAADAPPGARRLFEAAMAPFVGVVTHTAVSSAGEPRAVLDADAAWRQVNDALAAERRAIETDPELSAELRNAALAYLSAFATLPESERRERLIAPARDLLGFAHPLLAPGQSTPYSAASQTPFGGSAAITGTLTLVSATANEARFRTDAKSDPADVARAAAAVRATLAPDAPPARRAAVESAAQALGGMAIEETADIIVSRATGLVTRMHSVRRMTLGTEGGATAETAERELRLLP